MILFDIKDEKIRAKISRALKGNKNAKGNHSNKGRKFGPRPFRESPWHKGEKHWNWKGGITLKKPARRLKDQERIAGRIKPEFCELYKRKGRIVFDHNHETGKFRGWLCNGCNIFLGHAKENIPTLQKMIAYLENDGTVP